MKPSLGNYLAISALLLFLFAPSLRATAAPPSVNNLDAKTQLAVDRLQQWYNPQTGLWNHTGWWNSANALTALVDFARVSGTTQYNGVIAQTYSRANHAKPDFLNQYYDDEGWWALAWIDAYDLTGNKQYLGAAATIFQNMSGGWDQTCGGGLWWSKKRKYKNAIANELFLSVAAHLANRSDSASQRSYYLNWAIREWTWFRRSGMIERDHLISDGLTPQCTDNHRRKWSYNQGVILGGLSQLSQLPGQHRDLHDAQKIANAATRRLTDRNGILHDACEPHCGGDGTQFKGIFVRNLADLYPLAPHARWQRFILRNANSILTNDQNPDHSFGVVWSGPPGPANPSTQTSALDALIAAIQLQHHRSSP